MARKHGRARHPSPLPPRRVTGAAGPKRKLNGTVRLTMPIREAAAMVNITWRTLRKLLEDDPCLLFIASRYMVDVKGFAKWCRAQGIRTTVAVNQ